jgi:hypothetical protein
MKIYNLTNILWNRRSDCQAAYHLVNIPIML